MCWNEQAIAARNAYRREYYRTHKEVIKRQQRRYWEKKAREAAERETGNKPATEAETTATI